MQAASLTFEQQKELLALQFEQETHSRHFEREEKLELEKLQQAEKLELEKMHQETERRKLDLEQSRLELIREGKLVPGGSGGHDDASMGSAPGGLLPTCV